MDGGHIYPGPQDVGNWAAMLWMELFLFILLLLAAPGRPQPPTIDPGGQTYVAPPDGCRTVPPDTPFCGGISTTAAQAHVDLVARIASLNLSDLAVVPSQNSSTGPAALRESVCGGGDERSSSCVESALRILCTSLNGWHVSRYMLNSAPWNVMMHMPPIPGLWAPIRNGDLLGTSLRPSADGSREWRLPPTAPSARYCADGYALLLDPRTGEARARPGTPSRDTPRLECASSCLDMASVVSRDVGLGHGVLSRPTNLCLNWAAFHQDASDDGTCYGRSHAHRASVLITVACTVFEPGDPCSRLARWGGLGSDVSPRNFTLGTTPITVEVLRDDPAYLLADAVQASIDLFSANTSLSKTKRVLVSLPTHRTALVTTKYEYPETEILTIYPFGGGPDPLSVRHYVQALVPVAHDDAPLLDGYLGRLAAAASTRMVSSLPLPMLNASTTLAGPDTLPLFAAATESLRRNGVAGAWVPSIAAEAPYRDVLDAYAARASAAPRKHVLSMSAAACAALAGIYAALRAL